MQEHKITGKIFLNLKKEDLQEMLPFIGEGLPVSQLIEEITNCGKKADKPEEVYKLQVSNTYSPTGWVNSFELPERFSQSTMKAIQTGEGG